METAMTTVPSQSNETLEIKIQTRFAKFNRMIPPAKGRRYPKELLALIKQGSAQGISAEKICKLTGISQSSANRWFTETAKPAEKPALISSAKVCTTAPRRLEVVDSTPEARVVNSVVVRFSSGVTVELYDANLLTLALLKNLQALGVDHASSC
jgi:hypothetical protein